MKSPRTHILFAALSLCSVLASYNSTDAYAEDLKPIFEKVQQYYQEKNYAKALEELSWAQKEIEKANTQATVSFFPDEVDGFKGGKVENVNVFGITNIERTYKKSSDSIKVSLLGGSKGQQNPLGGLAAMGQMAAMMGGQAGMDSFRMDGRTATLEKQDDAATLTVFLDGGSMMKFEMNGSSDAGGLKKFANSFKIADIEKHLKG
jgi:hypothetical protein